MKTIGIVGITAEGASDCYKRIVQIASEKLGPNQHPEIVLVSPSFDTILTAQKQHDWQKVADILSQSAQKCIAGGADFIIMPANSVHFAYNLVAQKTTKPVLNIVDTVVYAAQHQGFQKVSVLGVGMTMVDGLYDKALNDSGIEQIKLNQNEIKSLDDIIYNELVKGITAQPSIEKVIAMCARLQEDGSEALILACTELQMILHKSNAPLPILDSTELLAIAAVDKALE